jgi:predicted RNase H-like HicB family nuclease
VTRRRPSNTAAPKPTSADVQPSPGGRHSGASANNIKIVDWSDEDQSYIGYCPGVIGPCCHGDDEVEVFRCLCEIVDVWLETCRKDSRPFPPPTVGRDVGAFLHNENDSVRHTGQRTTRAR